MIYDWDSTELKNCTRYGTLYVIAKINSTRKKLGLFRMRRKGEKLYPDGKMLWKGGALAPNFSDLAVGDYLFEAKDGTVNMLRKKGDDVTLISHVD